MYMMIPISGVTILLPQMAKQIYTSPTHFKAKNKYKSQLEIVKQPIAGTIK